MAVAANYEGSGYDFVQVYKFNESINDWEELGSQITNGSATSNFGCSISLNDKGDKLVIGDSEKDNKGSVYYYEYNNSTTDWNLIDTYTGPANIGQNAKAGFDVKLISIGNSPNEIERVIIGEPNYGATVSTDYGRFRTSNDIFPYNTSSYANKVGNHDGLGSADDQFAMPFL